MEPFEKDLFRKRFSGWIAPLGAIAVMCSGASSFADCQRDIYTIKKGDTLSEIIFRKEKEAGVHERIYGKSGLLEALVALNPKVVHNPDRIYPDKKITLPDALTPELVRSPDCSRGLSGMNGEEDTSASLATDTAGVAAFNSASQDSSGSQAASEPLAGTSETPSGATEPSVSETASNSTEVEQPQTAESQDLSENSSDQNLDAPSGEASENQPLFSQGTRVDLGVGMLPLHSLTRGVVFPQFYASSRIQILDKLFVLPMFQGALPQYSYGTPGWSPLEWQFRLGVGYSLLNNHLILGLGARYFTFGYSSTVDAQATSIDGVFTVGYRFEPVNKLEIEALVDTRVAFSLGGAAADGFAGGSQFSGVGILLQGHYLLSPRVYLGPYFTFDMVNLRWTQTAGSATGTGGFNPTQLGFGFHVGFGL